MRRLLRRAFRAAAPQPGIPAPRARPAEVDARSALGSASQHGFGASIPPFPMIDGGALACTDLAASLATLASCYRRTSDARHA